jgi:phage tail protein X
MKTYRASEGERLDTIVYAHYDTLEVFPQVLQLNARLTTLLKDGDIVKLPDITITAIKEPELW